MFNIRNTHVFAFWVVVLSFIACVVVLMFAPPANARSSHVTIGRSYPSYAPLMSRFGPAIQHGRQESRAPNACDDLGIEGIESLSGGDAGTCYPSIAGRR